MILDRDTWTKQGSDFHREKGPEVGATEIQKTFKLSFQLSRDEITRQRKLGKKVTMKAI